VRRSAEPARRGRPDRGLRHTTGALLLATATRAEAVEPVDFRQGARLLGAIAELRQDAGGVRRTTWQENVALERRFEEPLVDILGRETYSLAVATGAGMSIEETIELARRLVGQRLHT
jgi:hypothetical protein